MWGCVGRSGLNPQHQPWQPGERCYVTSNALSTPLEPPPHTTAPVLPRPSHKIDHANAIIQHRIVLSRLPFGKVLPCPPALLLPPPPPHPLPNHRPLPPPTCSPVILMPYSTGAIAVSRLPPLNVMPCLPALLLPPPLTCSPVMLMPYSTSASVVRQHTMGRPQ